MKKIWERAELVELDMKDTFGGPVSFEVVDNFFYNDEKNHWERWRGEDYQFSSQESIPYKKTH